MTIVERPYVAQEASRREASFLGNLAGAQDDYEWIVENQAWVALGHESFASWWESRVRPVMHALSMRPTREVAAKVIEQVRTEEAELPPLQRRTQQELADLAGVHRDTVSGRKTQDRPGAEFPPTKDLEPSSTVDNQPPPVRWPARTARRSVPVTLTLRTHTGEEVPYRQPQAKATFNETTGEGISWAAWSWNPVTGCLHGCDYCYARAIAARFPDGFPVGFTPLFHHERLDAPANTTIPAARADDPAYRRVFVCSMADLYGRWVPDDWIEQVHASMLASPQWEYLLLTKFPARYVGLDLPSNAWVGTSVDEQKRVRIAEDAFRKIDGVKVKWLSLEPLREPLEFEDLSMFNWVVIGAQTETRQPDGTVPAFAPPVEWVGRITQQALDAGCKVHHKPNLRANPGMQLRDEYPA